MSFNDFMAKVRHWDNRCALWMMRHFYIVFFEFVLVIIFFIFLYNTFRTLDIAANAASDNILQQLLAQQTINTHIIILLLLLNSFWLLYMFNGINRLRVILKEISFLLTRRRQRN